MPTVLFDTTDLAEAEEKLSANFARVKLASPAGEEPARIRVLRSTVGSMTLDDSSLSGEVNYRMEPPDKVLVCRGYSGVVEGQHPRHPRVVVGAGQVGAFGALDGLPITGEGRRAHLMVVSLDRGTLDEVAATDVLGDFELVRLTGSAPVSPAAGRYLLDLIDYIYARAANNRHASNNALLAGAVQRHLSAAVLTTFPNTALLQPTIDERNQSTPVLLRRAMAFIDDNAHRDISLTVVARDVHVTPRALQYMFRKHRDCTPSEYLRRVRLHYAHLELVDGNCATTTVGEVARRWGFGNPGRFAILYRQTYGRSSHVTLRG